MEHDMATKSSALYHNSICKPRENLGPYPGLAEVHARRNLHIALALSAMTTRGQKCQVNKNYPGFEDGGVGSCSRDF